MNTSTDDERVANSVVSLVVSWLFLQAFDFDPDAGSFFKFGDGGLQQIAVRMVSQQDANLLVLSQSTRG